MAALAARVLAAALLEGDDRLAAALLDQFAGHRGARYRRAPDRDGLAADQEHFAELDRVAGFSRNLVDRDQVLLGDPILLPAGPDDCEHGYFPRLPRRSDRRSDLSLCPGRPRVALRAKPTARK